MDGDSCVMGSTKSPSSPQYLHWNTGTPEIPPQHTPPEPDPSCTPTHIPHYKAQHTSSNQLSSAGVSSKCSTGREQTALSKTLTPGRTTEYAFQPWTAEKLVGGREGKGMQEKKKGKLCCFLTGLAGCTGGYTVTRGVSQQLLGGYMRGGYLPL